MTNIPGRAGVASTDTWVAALNYTREKDEVMTFAHLAPPPLADWQFLPEKVRYLRALINKPSE